METGKGWHNESMRHSEARLYGRTSSKQLRLKGSKKFMSNKQIEQEYNAISKPKYRTYEYTSKEEQAEFEKERKEHPSFTDKEVRQIVKDHEPEEKETRESSRQKALYFKKELLKETRKEHPDPDAIAYYRKEFLYWKRKTGKTYFVPVTKK